MSHFVNRIQAAHGRDGDMGQIASSVMASLHGVDIYDGFEAALGEDLQGWNSDHPVLGQAVATLKPRVVVDVGVWKGRSSIFLANMLQRHGIDGVVVSVDTFLGSTEHWINRADPDFHASLRMQHGMPRLYWQFLSNVVRYGCADRIVPLPQTSGNAALILRALGIVADLVHIDAAHEHDAVLADARAYWQLLAPGGLLVGDDYAPDWPEVMSAAGQFAAEADRSLQIMPPKWIVQKDGPQSA